MSRSKSTVKIDDAGDIDAVWADALTRARTLPADHIPPGWWTSNMFAERTGKTLNAALAWLQAECQAGRMQKDTVTMNGKRRNIYRPIQTAE